MTYVELVGDLFQAGLPAIGHGCNCSESMSGGIAREVRHRFPELYDAYAADCRAGRFELGGFTAWEAPDVVVYNLGTQRLPGRNADLGAIACSVRSALEDVAARGLPELGVPRLGAGIGGLRWGDVEKALRAEAERSVVDLVVVTRP